MTALTLRIVAHVHGHLGWLSAIALLHPALLLRNPKRRALLAAALATGLVTLTGSLGWLLYPAYRTLLKPKLFATSAAVGNAFERKEHLALGAIALAWVGLAAHWAECRDRGLVAQRSRIAFVSYVAAATLAAVTASLGLLVAVYRAF